MTPMSTTSSASLAGILIVALAQRRAATFLESKGIYDRTGSEQSVGTITCKPPSVLALLAPHAPIFCGFRAPGVCDTAVITTPTNGHGKHGSRISS